MKEKHHPGKCPICAEKTSPFFSVPCDFRKPANAKNYSVEWCHKCDYGHIWERPSKTDVSSFYALDNYYTHNASDTHKNQENYSFLDRLRTHLSWRLDKGKGLTPLDAVSLLEGKNLTICEIGCGNGDNLLKFRDQGFSVTGVEPDPKARQAAKKDVVHVYEGTAEELPEVVLNNQYDIVLMSHVLEHCLDVNAAVANAKVILKNGGVFVVETPNCKSHGFKDYRGEWAWSDIPRHLNFFTPTSLNLILEKHGFSVKATKYTGFYRQFTNSWLQNEEEVRRVFAACNAKPTFKLNYKLRSWILLFKSTFSPKAHKYDSVWLIARKT